jgi:hypothetical protein
MYGKDFESSWKIKKFYYHEGLMHQPAELSTRQMAAAINRLNNAIPLFPLGSTESKFSEKEIVGLLEWSLPQA